MQLYRIEDGRRIPHNVVEPSFQKARRETPTHPAAGDNPVIQAEPVPTDHSSDMLGRVLIIGIFLSGLFSGWALRALMHR